MLPPSRWDDGFFPNAISIAALAPAIAGEAIGVIAGGDPVDRATSSNLTPTGTILSKYATSASPIASASWFGTSRHVIFTLALFGNTVFPPGPWYPDVNPFTSSVGRAHFRS